MRRRLTARSVVIATGPPPVPVTRGHLRQLARPTLRTASINREQVKSVTSAAGRRGA
jgi:hypothetical protein